MSKPHNQNFFANMANEFNSHVRESIPYYHDYVEWAAEWIASNFKDGRVLDLFGSDGEFGRILRRHGFKGEYINIDGSPKMIELANKKLSKYEPSINILGGIGASWVDDGIKVEEVRLDGLGQFDVVIEHLGFQFFTSEREKYIREIRGISVIFMCLEKFTADDDIFYHYERLKNSLWESRHFTEDEMYEKEKTVPSKMNENLVSHMCLYNTLKGVFGSVHRTFKAGNFSGFIAVRSIHYPIKVNPPKYLINNIFNNGNGKSRQTSSTNEKVQ